MFRHLSFQPVLPAYSDNACTRSERREDRRRNDEAFFASLERLFAALPPIGEVEGAPLLRLFLTAPYSPNDHSHRDERAFGTGYNVRDLGIKGDISNTRFEHSYLQFTKSAKFQNLNKISQFGVDSGPRFYGSSVSNPTFEEYAADR